MVSCLVANCTNKRDEGEGYCIQYHKGSGASQASGWICFPCFNFLRSGEGNTSQLYRNTQKKEGEVSMDEKIARVIEEKPEYDPLGDSLSLYLAGIPYTSESGAWVVTYDYERGDKQTWEPIDFATEKGWDLVVKYIQQHFSIEEADRFHWIVEKEYGGSTSLYLSPPKEMFESLCTAFLKVLDKK